MNPLDALMRLAQSDLDYLTRPTTLTTNQVNRSIADAQLDKCLRELMPMIKASLAPCVCKQHKDIRQKLRNLVSAWEATQKRVKP